MGVTLRCGVFTGGGAPRGWTNRGNFAGPEAIWLVLVIPIIGVLCFPI